MQSLEREYNLALGEQFEVFDGVVDEAYEIIDNIFVTTEDGEVLPWAADDENYRYAVFTSDACKILLDLYTARSDPRAYEILVTKGPAILKTICREQWLSSQQPKIWKNLLKYRQQMRKVQRSEAEVGQFPHEQRREVWGPGIIADEAARERLAALGPARGGSKEKLVDYGRVDSVGLVLNTYARLRSIPDERMQTALDKPFEHSTGIMRTLEQAMLDAGGWIERRIKKSCLGFVERLPAFPGDRRHKGWKDSLTSHPHEDGSFANTEQEVADIEVQTEYVEALKEYAGILEAGGNREKANEIHWMRHQLTYAIVKRFWAQGRADTPGIQHEDHLVTAIDRDNQGNPRHLTIPGGTAISCLRYGLYDGEMDTYPIAAAAVRAVNSDDLSSPIGTYSRSARFRHIPGFLDLQGNPTVWLTEVGNIGEALYRARARHTLAKTAVNALAGAVVGGLREYNLWEDGHLLLPDNEKDERTAPYIGKSSVIELPGEGYAQGRQGFSASGAIALRALLNRISVDIAFDYQQGQVDCPWWLKDEEMRVMTENEVPIYFRPQDAIDAIRRSIKLYKIKQIPMNATFEPAL